MSRILAIGSLVTVLGCGMALGIGIDRLYINGRVTPANFSVSQNVNGYEIHGVRLDFVGVCPDCQEQRSSRCKVSANQEGAGSGAETVSGLGYSGVEGCSVNSRLKD